MKLFKNLFKKEVKKQSQPVIEKPKITLSDIKQFDDVWIKVQNTVCEGWVVERQNNMVDVVYTSPSNVLEETIFIIERPLNRSQLTHMDKTMYLIKEEAYK